LDVSGFFFKTEIYLCSAVVLVVVVGFSVAVVAVGKTASALCGNDWRS